MLVQEFVCFLHEPQSSLEDVQLLIATEEPCLLDPCSGTHVRKKHS